MTDRSNAKRRRGLGRGLDALLSSVPVGSPEEKENLVAEAESGGIRMVAVDAILPNPQQPRTNFEPAAIAELAASIAEHGIIQPLIVTETPDQPDHYWIIAGERRWRAAQQAGQDQVPAIVREATSQQLLEWALVENVQRADLNPLEEAAAYQSLMDEFGLTQADVAQRVGKSRSAVANAVRLLALPAAVQQALNEGRISAGHARALLALPDAKRMEDGLSQVVSRDLNVRQTEAWVRAHLTPTQPSTSAEEPSSQLAAHFRSLEERFRSRLGTKVNLDRRNDGSGRLVIHFYNDQDLETIYQQIIGSTDHEEL